MSQRADFVERGPGIFQRKSDHQHARRATPTRAVPPPPSSAATAAHSVPRPATYVSVRPPWRSPWAAGVCAEIPSSWMIRFRKPGQSLTIPTSTTGAYGRLGSQPPNSIPGPGRTAPRRQRGRRDPSPWHGSLTWPRADLLRGERCPNGSASASSSGAPERARGSVKWNDPRLAAIDLQWARRTCGFPATASSTGSRRPGW